MTKKNVATIKKSKHITNLLSCSTLDKIGLRYNFHGILLISIQASDLVYLSEATLAY